MRFLLDTHALIWWWLEDPMLSSRARTLIESGDEDILVSAISAYEIALKVQAGQLRSMIDTLEQFETATQEDRFVHLPLRYDHARLAGLLPGRHRDPFDRMIAAQGQIEGLTVITRDPQIAALGRQGLW